MDKWSAAALRDRSDLATGTTAPSRARAAGQFWTFTMSNSEARKQHGLVGIAWRRFTLRTGDGNLSSCVARPTVRASGAVRSHASACDVHACADAHVGSRTDVRVSRVRVVGV